MFHYIINFPLCFFAVKQILTHVYVDKLFFLCLSLRKALECFNICECVISLYQYTEILLIIEQTDMHVVLERYNNFMYCTDIGIRIFCRLLG